MSKFQSVSLPSLSTTADNREIENETRKMGLDILQKLNAVWDGITSLFVRNSAGGVAGGIYDSGTNANGSWIRFTDGTMMQWGNTTNDTASAIATGGYFGATAGNVNGYDDTPITFPIPFTSLPSVSTGQVSNVVMSNPFSITTTGFSLRVLDNVAFAINAKQATWLSIGRWK